MHPFLDSISEDYDGAPEDTGSSDLRELFQNALDRQRFLIVTQPVVDAVTWRLLHSECLLRYRRPSGPMFAAADIVPMAEQANAVAPLDRFSLSAAAGLLNSLPDTRFSINVSRRSLADQSLRDNLSELAANNLTAVARLIIEITETALPDNQHDLEDFIGFVRRLGLRVAIDDFGVGVTSWKELSGLQVDIVKFDKSLCSETGHMPELLKEAIARSKERDIFTVAEGVDSVKSAERLRAMGVDALQGYLFGRPLP